MDLGGRLLDTDGDALARLTGLQHLGLPRYDFQPQTTTTMLDNGAAGVQPLSALRSLSLYLAVRDVVPAGALSEMTPTRLELSGPGSMQPAALAGATQLEHLELTTRSERGTKALLHQVGQPPDAWQDTWQRPVQEMVVESCVVRDPHDVASTVATCPGLRRLTLHKVQDAQWWSVAGCHISWRRCQSWRSSPRWSSTPLTTTQ
jgi:hypothetical protein